MSSKQSQRSIDAIQDGYYLPALVPILVVAQNKSC